MVTWKVFAVHLVSQDDFSKSIHCLREWEGASISVPSFVVIISVNENKIEFDDMCQ